MQLGHILITGSITLLCINCVNWFDNIFLQAAGLLAAAVCLYYLTLDYQDKKDGEHSKLYAAYIGLLNVVWCVHVIYVVLGVIVRSQEVTIERMKTTVLLVLQLF